MEPVKDRIRINISDVRDRSSINYLVKGQDYLFNLAGNAQPHRLDARPLHRPGNQLCQPTAYPGSVPEEKYNPGIKIVFAGTRGQYGRAQYLPVDEKHPLHSSDVNGINNNAGENYHLLYNEVYGIRACSLRLTNTYGPRHEMKHPRQGVLNWFIRQIIDGLVINIYGSGSQIRDTNYVDDVVDAMLLAMMTEATNGEVFNLGGEPLSLVQFVEALIEVNGGGKYELVAFPGELKAIEIGDYIASYAKFTALTGWEPKVDLKEGLAKSLEYYRANGPNYWSRG